MSKRPPKAAAALAAAVLFGSIFTVPASGDEGQDTPDPTAPAVKQLSRTEIADTRGYWTKERFQSAKPLDQVIPDQPAKADQPATSGDEIPEESESAVFSKPVAPEQDASQEQVNGERVLTGAPVPNTLGRLFFTTPDGVSSCTASTVSGGGGVKIITAGHCVHGGKGGEWYSDFAFVPKYSNGSGPYGTWYGNTAVTFKAWSQDGNFRYDQAFISLDKKNNRSIVQTVGGNGLIGGSGKNVKDNRIWGYPALSPYNGSTAHYCDTAATSAGNSSSDSQATCNINEGSSGGPWLTDRVNDNLGYTWAVTSRCAGPGANPDTKCALTKLYASPNPREIFDLLTFTL